LQKYLDKAIRLCEKESSKANEGMMKLKEKQCVICNSTFIAAGGNAKFCPACKQNGLVQKYHIETKALDYGEAHRKAALKWQRTNKEKQRAHELVMRNPKRLVVLYECPCIENKKHHHHHDYSQPYSVILLCHKCHRLEHDRLNKLTQSS